ncbi:hypothetical protein C8J57DRAFT_1255296 [Mycena rebaudengoi]|nr:hypothetical protein C8J57DRAFT_1255296 [Mycena rebaudengoi]
MPPLNLGYTRYTLPKVTILRSLATIRLFRGFPPQPCTYHSAPTLENNNLSVGPPLPGNLPSTTHLYLEWKNFLGSNHLRRIIALVILNILTPGDFTFWLAKVAWPRANWLVWRGRGRGRGRGRLVGQADWLTPIKAHASLSACHANINFADSRRPKAPVTPTWVCTCLRTLQQQLLQRQKY